MPTTYNKVEIDGTTLIDISEDTVAADKVLAPYTLHLPSGASATGTIQTKTSSDLTANTLTVTAPAGYYANAATKTLSDANLVAANIKKNTTIFGVTGSYEGGGSSKATQVVQGTTRTTSSTLTAIGAEMTVGKTGTYDVYWSGFRSSTSSSYTYATQLFIDNVAYGSENSTWSNHIQNNHLSSVSLTADQKIRVRGRCSRGSSYYIYAPTLVIVEA